MPALEGSKLKQLPIVRVAREVLAKLLPFDIGTGIQF